MEQANKALAEKINAEVDRHGKVFEELGVNYTESVISEDANRAFKVTNVEGLDTLIGLVLLSVMELRDDMQEIAECSGPEANKDVLDLLKTGLEMTHEEDLKPIEEED